MKKLIFVALNFLLISSCFAQSAEVDVVSEQYFNENIAITRIKARVLSNGTYVLELTLKDFNRSLRLPRGLGLNDFVLSDDGLKNDLVASDGVYSSTNALRFKNGQPSTLEKDYQITGARFRFTSALDLQTSVEKVKVGCKMTKDGCPRPDGSSCYACIWFGWQCWSVTECNVDLEF